MMLAQLTCVGCSHNWGPYKARNLPTEARVCRLTHCVMCLDRYLRWWRWGRGFARERLLPVYLRDYGWCSTLHSAVCVSRENPIFSECTTAPTHAQLA